jgi:hypothetical protein
MEEDMKAIGDMKAIAILGASVPLSTSAVRPAWAGNDDDEHRRKETVLYVWAGDQARTKP